MNSHEVMNVFYFKRPDGFDADGCQTLAEEVAASWGSHLSARQPSALTLVRVEATSLRADPDFTYVLPVGSAGTISNPILPGNATLSIKFLTGLTGRSQRGRMYWLQLMEDAVVGDIVDSGDLADILSAVEQFFGSIATAMPGVDHVVVSYCAEDAWRTEGQATPVLTYDSDGVVDSQRRRLVGRGR